MAIAVVTISIIIVLDIDPRYCNSTPVDDYDRGGHLYYNHTSPVDAYNHQRHRHSIGMAPGLYIVMEIQKSEQRSLLVLQK